MTGLLNRSPDIGRPNSLIFSRVRGRGTSLFLVIEPIQTAHLDQLRLLLLQDKADVHRTDRNRRHDPGEVVRGHQPDKVWHRHLKSPNGSITTSDCEHQSAPGQPQHSHSTVTAQSQHSHSTVTAQMNHSHSTVTAQMNRAQHRIASTNQHPISACMSMVTEKSASYGACGVV